MEIATLMPLLGGVATRQMLVRLTSRRALDDAIDAGLVVRIARGRYAVPEVHAGTELALKVAGHVCLVSAALAHGWKVKLTPDRPQIAVPKDRRIDQTTKALMVLSWIDLSDDQTEGLATDAATTLEMCGRRMPFDEAAKGPGSARLRRVAAHADRRAANPFESVLRAIALEIAGLHVEPQVRLRGRLGLDVRPDLADRRLRIVLEADSFEWHGDRAALRRDARRYDLLVANGWAVLRFSWEDVMHQPEWVRSVIQALVDERTEQLTQRAALV